MFMNKRIALVISAILLFLLIYYIFNFVRVFLPEKTSAAPTLVLHKTPDIASWHLFGNYRDNLLPETNLQLDLEGIFISPDSKKSQVLVNAKLYGIGDIIPGGAKIVKILPDRVTLRHNGKLETLPLLLPKLHWFISS